MIKKSYTFDYVALILGATIGAGFASGQEIVTFFTRFGYVSILYAVLFFAIFSYCLYLLFSFGACNECNIYLNQSHFNDVLNIIFYVISANMLAGANELLTDLIFNFKFPLYSTLILFATYFIVNKGFKFIFAINKIVVPLMFAFTLIVCTFSFFVSPHSAVAINLDFSNLAMLTASCILYTFCNVLVISKIVVDAGKTIQPKIAKKVCLISGGLLCGLIVLIISVLLINDNSVLFLSLPMVYIAFLINNTLGYCYSAIILCSILTTLIATVYSLIYSKKKYIKNSIFIYLIIFVLSLFGFKNLIKFTYPILGAIGFAFVYSIKNLKLRNNIV